MDGDAPVKKEARQPLTAKDWKLVFHRKLIGVYLGQFAVASTLWFFLTWFPNYLTQEKGITALKAGFMTRCHSSRRLLRPALWLGRGSAGT